MPHVWCHHILLSLALPFFINAGFLTLVADVHASQEMHPTQFEPRQKKGKQGRTIFGDEMEYNQVLL